MTLWILILVLLSADCAAVAACMLGTTQFVNACVQRRGLTQVMVFRLCGPATHALPPFCDIPTDLGNTLRGQYRLLDGTDTFQVRSWSRVCRSGRSVR